RTRPRGPRGAATLRPGGPEERSPGRSARRAAGGPGRRRRRRRGPRREGPSLRLPRSGERPRRDPRNTGSRPPPAPAAAERLVPREGRSPEEEGTQEAPRSSLGGFREGADPPVEQAHSRLAALLRMELEAEDPPRSDGRRKGLSVAASGQHEPFGGGPRGEGVDEVEVGARAPVSKERCPRRRGFDPVPADVRDAGPAEEPGHAARQERQAARLAPLLARFEEQLHAQADPEHARAAGGRGTDRSIETGLFQAARSLGEGPDPGEDEEPCGSHRRRLRRRGDFVAEGLEGPPDAPEIREPEVRQDDLHTSVPFVEGIVP